MEFDYDSASRLIEMVDSIGTTEWTYNDIGRLTSTDDPWDFTHALTYNAEGMITALTCEGDSRSYSWNSSGQMTSATRDSLTTNFTYNDASWITEIALPNDVDTDYTYNTRGWMTAIDTDDTSTTPATEVLDLDYTYDANGNITSEDVGSDSWSYTYDALNRLTAVDKPGTSDDIAYTYDARGNRTDIDVGGTDNTDLTFNLADQLTRVDYEDNSYRVFTYDDNGNCTKEEYYSGTYLASTVIIPQLSSSHRQGEALSSPPLRGGKGSEASQGGLDWNTLSREEQQTLKSRLLEDNEELQATREHYPYTKAPPSLLRSRYLSPYIPDITSEDVFTHRTLELTNPTMAELIRNQVWDPYSANPADEQTDYEYDQENRLVEATLPSGVVVEFYYDGSGRRLKKVITDDTGDDTLITTWKYHWLGGQITTMEVDAVEVDDSEPPVETAVRDETLHIHLGPNGQPLSFEWVRYDYDTSTTLDDTYYYHYDIHGNVIKVTDSSATTKISYEYDVLGEITSTSNPDNITNPFAWGGASQLIFDDVLNVYSNQAGSYRADTGTLLGGGAPVFVNPTSLRPVEHTAQFCSSGAGTVGDIGVQILINLIGNYLYDRITDWLHIWGDVRRWKANAFDVNHTFGYVNSVTINSSGLASLFNSKYRGPGSGWGWTPVYKGRRIHRKMWMEGHFITYDDEKVKVSTYCEDGEARSIRAAGIFTDLNAVTIETNSGMRKIDFAAYIFDLQCSFDSVYGANAYKSSKYRNQWFIYLYNKINKSGDPWMDGGRDEFIDAFEEAYGDLPDADDDDIPDIWDLNPNIHDDDTPDSSDWRATPSIPSTQSDKRGLPGFYPPRILPSNTKNADMDFIKRPEPPRMGGKTRPGPEFWERYDHLGIRAPDPTPIKVPIGVWKPGRGKPGSPGNPEPPDRFPRPILPSPPGLPW